MGSLFPTFFGCLLPTQRSVFILEKYFPPLLVGFFLNHKVAQSNFMVLFPAPLYQLQENLSIGLLEELLQRHAKAAPYV
jgi:hypothetical protein